MIAAKEIEVWVGIQSGGRIRQFRQARGGVSKKWRLLVSEHVRRHLEFGAIRDVKIKNRCYGCRPYTFGLTANVLDGC
jgi:hypothetical protein